MNVWNGIGGIVSSPFNGHPSSIIIGSPNPSIPLFGTCKSARDYQSQFYALPKEHTK
jgi:hypothetical protein